MHEKLIDNRVCDVVRWLSFEPRHSCAAARDQFTNIDDSGRDLWIRPKVAFGTSYLSKSLGEFDPGSGRTLAACLTHASQGGPQGQPANGCVTREQPALVWGIAGLTPG